MSRKQELLVALMLFLTSFLAGNSLAEIFAPEPKTLEIARATVGSSSMARTRLPSTNGQVGTALDFELLDENADLRSLASIQQGKPAFVYVFAGGCGHCNTTLRDMTRLLPEARMLGYQIVGVHYYGSPQTSKTARDSFNLPSPVFSDGGGKLCQQLGIGEFSNILVGADGIVHFRRFITSPQNWPESAEMARIAAIPATAQTAVTGNSQPQNVSTFNVVTPAVKFDSRIMDWPDTVMGKVNYTLAGIILLFLPLALFHGGREKSWFPPLAAIGLLVGGAITGIWIYWPAVIILPLVAVLLMIRYKHMIWPALVLNAILLTVLILPEPINMRGSEALTTSTWRFLPYALVSLLLFRLAFITQKLRYEKFAYAGAGDTAEPAHDGAIAIRGVSRPERCDICHQADQFNTKTAFCTRCQRYTI